MPDFTTTLNLLTMEHFRPLTVSRFGDRFRTTPRGTHVYYVGHLGTVVSASAALRGRSMELERLKHDIHERTRHHRVQVATMDLRAKQRRSPEPRYMTLGVHTAVLLAWEGGRDVEEVRWDDACHLNDNVNDNRLRNLTWGDRRMNALQREQRKRERAAELADAAVERCYVPDGDYGF